MTVKIFLTGATGAMGIPILEQLLQNDQFHIRILVNPTPLDLKIAARYQDNPRVEAYNGDLRVYEDVKRGVDGADIVLHVGGIVSPMADYHPKLTMSVNYGSTLHMLRAIQAQPDPQRVKFVFISSVVAFGDRLPPIHWGRTGDPVKPSINDYYALSKVASERAIIESGLTNWVILRQTGLLSVKTARVMDGIIFHNCLNNPLEYVSDRDSAVLIRRICENAPDHFWGRVYNIGGGPSCRMSFYELFKAMLSRLGIDDLSQVLETKWFALRNFHGVYFLDSDELEQMFHFRSDSMDYFFDIYIKELGPLGKAAKLMNRFTLTKMLLTKILYNRFKKLVYSEHGTMRYIEDKNEECINVLFTSREKWDAIPDWEDFPLFTDWQNVIQIDHGYDETKPESALTLEDMKSTAEFRGGRCLSDTMAVGDMTTKLTWQCAFGHTFAASPKLILHAGYWCPICENHSWNYQAIAKVNPFFAQVWRPLHDEDELPHEYSIKVTPEDIQAEFGSHA